MTMLNLWMTLPSTKTTQTHTNVCFAWPERDKNLIDLDTGKAETRGQVKISSRDRKLMSSTV